MDTTNTTKNESWEKEIQRYFQEYELSKAIVLTRIYVKSNFIAKRDLRKLLEGKKKQLSQYDDDEKGLYDDAWNYNLTIDDILAEIEKL